MIPTPPDLPPLDLVASFRFAVTFFIGGVAPNPLDIRFQRVSGISAQIETQMVREGGQNLYTHRLPQRVGFGNLVLERGFVLASPLNVEVDAAMSALVLAPSNVLVTLLHEGGLPLAAWMFLKAYPVKWSTADLDATTEQVLIDTLELAYTRMQVLRVG
jgi:phage tail-like protein